MFSTKFSIYIYYLPFVLLGISKNSTSNNFCISILNSLDYTDYGHTTDKYFVNISSSILTSSLQHGADPTKKNRDGNTPLDLVKDGDTDIQDLLRGDAALLDAAKKGCLARVQKLCSPDNINCRDTQGRNSTPLHLAGSIHAGTRNSGHLSQCVPDYVKLTLQICWSEGQSQRLYFGWDL